MKLEERMNLNYSHFSENDRYICQFILENRKKCWRYTIDEFAAACHVSKTMLVRFSQKLGLPGFGELKAALRLESQEIMKEPGLLMDTVVSSYHKMVDEISRKNLNSLFDQMNRAERILVYGSGYAQARVASELKRIFLPARKTILHVHGHDMIPALTRMVTEKDLVVIISLSGESEAVISLAEKLRLKQVPALSITGMSNNRLASLCGENLYIHSIRLPDEYGIGYEISTPYFILIELLFLKYQIYLEQHGITGQS